MEECEMWEKILCRPLSSFLVESKIDFRKQFVFEDKSSLLKLFEIQLTARRECIYYS